MRWLWLVQLAFTTFGPAGNHMNQQWVVFLLPQYWHSPLSLAKKIIPIRVATPPVRYAFYNDSNKMQLRDSQRSCPLTCPEFSEKIVCYNDGIRLECSRKSRDPRERRKRIMLLEKIFFVSGGNNRPIKHYPWLREHTKVNTFGELIRLCWQSTKNLNQCDDYFGASIINTGNLGEIGPRSKWFMLHF